MIKIHTFNQNNKLFILGILIQHGPFTIFGYLMCNVLLAWATLHQPYISTPKQTLSSPLPQNANEWIHSVIFEPQPKIQLS